MFFFSFSVMFPVFIVHPVNPRWHTHTGHVILEEYIRVCCVMMAQPNWTWWTVGGRKMCEKRDWNWWCIQHAACISLSLSLSLSSLNEATDSPFYVCHTNCVVLCRIPFFLFSAELCINSHLSGSCVANRNVNLHIGWTHHPPAPYAYTLLLIIKCQADSNIGVQQVIYWN